MEPPKADAEHYYDAAAPTHPLQENYRLDDDRREMELQQQQQPQEEEQEEEEHLDKMDGAADPQLEQHGMKESVNATAVAMEDAREPKAQSKQQPDREVVHSAAAAAAVQQQQEEQTRSKEAANDAASKPSSTNDGVFPFEEILRELQKFKGMHGHADIPTSHRSFTKIVDALVNNGIEEETDKKWERQYDILKKYKEEYGECGIPYTDPKLGDWMAHHRKLKAEANDDHDPRTRSRLAKLDEIGFEWTLPVWDRRLRELTHYARENGHTDVPLQHPGGLGVWMLNQKFNLRDMSPERVAALDSIGFIWNHNRKKRNNKMWDQRYKELCEYVKVHETANVPTTATAGHSKLSKWVGKQREEYKKFIGKKSSQLDRHRIEKLNEIGFQWSMHQWTAIPWEERFEVRL